MKGEEASKKKNKSKNPEETTQKAALWPRLGCHHSLGCNVALGFLILQCFSLEILSSMLREGFKNKISVCWVLIQEQAARDLRRYNFKA